MKVVLFLVARGSLSIETRSAPSSIKGFSLQEQMVLFLVASGSSPGASGALSGSKWFSFQRQVVFFLVAVVLSPEASGALSSSKWFSLQKQVVLFLVASGSLSRSY